MMFISDASMASNNELCHLDTKHLGFIKPHVIGNYQLIFFIFCHWLIFVYRRR